MRVKEERREPREGHHYGIPEERIEDVSNASTTNGHLYREAGFFTDATIKDSKPSKIEAQYLARILSGYRVEKAEGITFK